MLEQIKQWNLKLGTCRGALPHANPRGIDSLGNRSAYLRYDIDHTAESHAQDVHAKAMHLVTHISNLGTLM